MMGCNIPRPWKRPPTPTDKEIMKQAINEPLVSLEAVKKTIQNDLFDAFVQFGQVAHDLSFHDTDLDKPIKRPLNCPNCCAPIAGPFCDYCGTVFEQSFSVLTTTDNEQIVIPIYIGGKYIDKVVKQNKTQFRSGNLAANVDAPPLPIMYKEKEDRNHDIL